MTETEASKIMNLLGKMEHLKSKGMDGKENDLQMNHDLSADCSTNKMNAADIIQSGAEYKPLSNNLYSIVQEAVDVLKQNYARRSESQELQRLLNACHFKSMITCHDHVAGNYWQPMLPEIPYEVDEDDDATVKVIRLVKSPSEPLGATFQVNEDTGGIVIARVLCGGAADRCGLIQCGDEVREVNGVRVLGKHPDDVIQLMSTSNGSITLTLIPTAYDFNNCNIIQSKMFVRAQFSYNPTDDKSIPCHEVGLAFNRGDILEIVSQDDTNWWQARRHGGGSTPGHAGLIPSRCLLQQRESVRLSTLTTNATVDLKENTDLKTAGSAFSPKSIKKLKKPKKSSPPPPASQRQQQQQLSDSPSISTLQQVERDHEDTVVSYEEVELYIPLRHGRQMRPIALVGPPGIGRAELRRKIIASDPSHFKEPIPHTSRPMKAGESDGKEYHFVSRSVMESGIANKSFIEYGEYKGNLYGTMFDEVRKITNSGMVCILCPNVTTLKFICGAQLTPFIIFVRPVTSSLRFMTSRANASRPFTENEFLEMLRTANDMDRLYGHYFDRILVNDDLETTVNELRKIILDIETEPHWIPTNWLQR